jgi:hypothetical protein
MQHFLQGFFPINLPLINSYIHLTNVNYILANTLFFVNNCTLNSKFFYKIFSHQFGDNYPYLPSNL